MDVDTTAKNVSMELICFRHTIKERNINEKTCIQYGVNISLNIIV